MIRKPCYLQTLHLSADYSLCNLYSPLWIWCMYLLFCKRYNFMNSDGFVHSPYYFGHNLSRNSKCSCCLADATLTTKITQSRCHLFHSIFWWCHYSFLGFDTWSQFLRWFVQRTTTHPKILLPAFRVDCLAKNVVSPSTYTSWSKPEASRSCLSTSVWSRPAEKLAW